MRYLSLIAFLIASVVSLDSNAVTVADFVRPSPLVDIQISPDGKHLAMLRREEIDKLYVVRRSDNSIVSGVNSSQGQRFHSFAWVNDGRLIIEPAVEIPTYDRALPTGTILTFGIDGQKNGYLRRNRGQSDAQMFSVVSLLPADPSHILVARYRFDTDSTVSSPYVRTEDEIGLTRSILQTSKSADEYAIATCSTGCEAPLIAAPVLEKLNILTGKSVEVITGPSEQGEFISDANGTRFLFTGIDSGLVSISTTDDAEWREVKYFTQYLELGVVPIGFDSEGNMIALDNLVDTLGISRLTEDGEIESVFRDRIADIDGIVRGRDGDILAASFTAGYRSWFYPEEGSDFAVTHQALRAAYPDSDIEITSLTNNNAEAIVRVYGDKNPGRYYVVNLVTRQAEDLLSSADWLDSSELVATLPVQIPTRDDFELHGYLTLPKSAQDTPPLIVMTQAHPFSDTYKWGYDAQAQLFANAGFAVLQINARGAPGYGLRYTTGSDAELELWSGNDIVDAVKWVSQQELINPNKVCILGEGRGAYSAMLAARSDDIFRCVVAANAEEDIEQPAISPTQQFASSLLQGRNPELLPWFDTFGDMSERVEAPALILDEHLIGSAGISRISETERLVETYEQIIAFLEESLSADQPEKRLNQPLIQILSTDERKELLAIMTKIHRDLKRATRERDPKNLPAGFERRAQSPEEKLRRVARALNGRDREVRKVLPEEAWSGYERLKQNYQVQVERSIRQGREIPEYVLPAAGR